LEFESKFREQKALLNFTDLFQIPRDFEKS
jgi:hypothetical protein